EDKEDLLVIQGVTALLAEADKGGSDLEAPSGDLEAGGVVASTDEVDEVDHDLLKVFADEEEAENGDKDDAEDGDEEEQEAEPRRASLEDLVLSLAHFPARQRQLLLQFIQQGRKPLVAPFWDGTKKPGDYFATEEMVALELDERNKYFENHDETAYALGKKLLVSSFYCLTEEEAAKITMPKRTTKNGRQELEDSKSYYDKVKAEIYQALLPKVMQHWKDALQLELWYKKSQHKTSNPWPEAAFYMARPSSATGVKPKQMQRAKFTNLARITMCCGGCMREDKYEPIVVLKLYNQKHQQQQEREQFIKKHGCPDEKMEDQFDMPTKEDWWKFLDIRVEKAFRHSCGPWKTMGHSLRVTGTAVLPLQLDTLLDGELDCIVPWLQANYQVQAPFWDSKIKWRESDRVKVRNHYAGIGVTEILDSGSLVTPFGRKVHPSSGTDLQEIKLPTQPVLTREVAGGERLEWTDFAEPPMLPGGIGKVVTRIVYVVANCCDLAGQMNRDIVDKEAVRDYIWSSGTTNFGIQVKPVPPVRWEIEGDKFKVSNDSDSHFRVSDVYLRFGGKEVMVSSGSPNSSNFCKRAFGRRDLKMLPGYFAQPWVIIVPLGGDRSFIDPNNTQLKVPKGSCLVCMGNKFVYEIPHRLQTPAPYLLIHVESLMCAKLSEKGAKDKPLSLDQLAQKGLGEKQG
ncbi:MAG: hypothetical protein SGARI_001296, partial [Bacillariaceae sp.]